MLKRLREIKLRRGVLFQAKKQVSFIVAARNALTAKKQRAWAGV